MMGWLERYRSRKKSDTTGPQELVKEAKAASARSEIRSEYIDVVNTRLQKRVEENHFGESLAAAWSPRKERRA